MDGLTYEYKQKYSWDVAQRKHEESGKNKGRYAKINGEPELRKFIGFPVAISVKTLYNNIDSGEIDVSRKDLLRKEGWKQEKTKPRKAADNLKGESIHNRPKEANDRSEYGH
ncbi:MAG: hypothetical protein LBQ15_00485 [Clostridium sp.]|nr:hypothetical protein [Clostridium sp.]